MKKLLVFLIAVAVLVPSLAEAAIARSSSGFLNYTATSGSKAFTNSSGNVMIACGTNQGGANDLNAPTYNGVTFTEMGTGVQEGSTGRYLHCYYLVNPATGSNTFASTRGSSADTWWTFVTYSGAGTSQPDNFTTQQFSPPIGTATTNLSTNVDNSWTILMAQGARGQTASTGSTFVVNNTSSAFQLYDSNGAQTPPGSKSMAFTQSSDDAAAATFMISVSPPVAAVIPSFGDFFLFE